VERKSDRSPRPWRTLHQAMIEVVRRLRAAGCQSLLAGGCVRDMMLGKRPHDYDVATDATPEHVMRIFPQTRAVGAQFGVVIVRIGGHSIEVATFRSDLEYQDGRRPERVVFTDARHDAERRDFTINGMFYDPLKREVIDYVGGQKDLEAKVIRAIGNAEERFAEDHLRMLRAIRFACRLGFRIEAKTRRAIEMHASKLKRISAERIAGEAERILTDPNRAEGMRLAVESGLSEAMFPGISREQLLAGIAVLEEFPKSCGFSTALAGLLYEAEPEAVQKVCRYLKLSNDVRKQTCWLAGHRAKLPAEIPMSVGRLKKWAGEPLFEPLVVLVRCVRRAKGESLSPLRALRRQIRELGEQAVRPARLLDGHELIRLGAVPGPMVGRLEKHTASRE